MTRTSRKENIKEMHREAIIHASEILMANNPAGLEKVTMDDIAKTADFTKRTLYQYFQSKEEIYVAIVIRGFEGMVHQLERVLDTTLHGLEQVKKFGLALIEYSQKDPLHFFATISYVPNALDGKVRPELMMELFRQGEISMSYLIDSIQKGMKDGSIRKDINPQEAAFSIWAMLTGLLTTGQTKQSYMLQTYGIDLPNWLEEATKLILDGLKG